MFWSIFLQSLGLILVIVAVGWSVAKIIDRKKDGEI